MLGLDDSELEQLANYRLVIDCPEVSLTPLSSSFPDPNFIGSGSITQNEEGRLILKILCKEANLPVAFSMGDKRPPYKENELEYFSLAALDIPGRKWTAEKIRPFNISSQGGRGYLIVSCDVNELTTISNSFCASKNELKVLFPGTIDIPCNTSTIIEILVEGEKRRSKGQLNRAHFKTNNFTIEITKETDWLHYEAESTSSPITDSVISAFFESLQFVLAWPLEWSVMQISPAGKARITKIRGSLKNKPPARRWPPLVVSGKDNADYVWNLFHQYFTYSLAQQEKSKPTIFEHIASVLLTRSALLPTEVLILRGRREKGVDCPACNRNICWICSQITCWLRSARPPPQG